MEAGRQIMCFAVGTPVSVGVALQDYLFWQAGSSEGRC